MLKMPLTIDHFLHLQIDGFKEIKIYRQGDWVFMTGSFSIQGCKGVTHLITSWPA